MTKCYKVDKDFYKFVNEDKSTASTVTMCAELAQKKIDAINKSATDLDENRRHTYHEYLNDFEQFLAQNDIDVFKSYLKTIKQKSEIKLKVGGLVFNQQKYDAFMDKRKKEYEQLVNEANALLSNPTRDNLKSADKLLQQCKEFENTQILKDDPQFGDPEYITISMTATEAFDTALKIINDQNKAHADAKQRVIDDLIANDRSQFKDISENDFQLVKTLKRLMNEMPFFKGFAFCQVWDKHGGIFEYNTLEDYFNRPRGDVQYKWPEIKIIETDIHALSYMCKLIGDYYTQRECERLKTEINSKMQAN